METNIDSQPKKLSSPKKSSSKNKEIVSMLKENKWWPFDQVDGKLLQKLHKQTPTQFEEAPI